MPLGRQGVLIISCLLASGPGIPAVGDGFSGGLVVRWSSGSNFFSCGLNWWSGDLGDGGLVVRWSGGPVV